MALRLQQSLRVEARFALQFYCASCRIFAIRWRIRLKSLTPKDYRLLPKLDAPAGYIVVLRDIDRDAYRLDSADHPATYFETLLAEVTGSFGIELISLLETDDLAASESQLFDAHHARLSDKWIRLDNHQMATLRQSVLQINTHRSLYLKPQRATSPKVAATKPPRPQYKRPAISYSRASAERMRRRASRSALAYQEAAAAARRRRMRLDDVNDRFDLLQYARDRLQPYHETLYQMKETFLDYTLLWLFVLFVLAFVVMVLGMKYASILDRVPY